VNLSIQLCIQAVTREVELTYNLIDWVKSFNITVELLKTVLPSISTGLDQFYYDANSFTLAMLSEPHMHTHTQKSSIASSENWRSDLFLIPYLLQSLFHSGLALVLVCVNNVSKVRKQEHRLSQIQPRLSLFQLGLSLFQHGLSLFQQRLSLFQHRLSIPAQALSIPA